jgi:hypothetical protein
MRRTEVDRLSEAHRDLDENEANFQRVVHYATGALWALGAVEPTLAALWDLLQEAAGEQGLRAALANSKR